MADQNGKCHAFGAEVYEGFIRNILNDDLLMNGWEGDVQKLVNKGFVSPATFREYKQDVQKLREKLGQYATAFHRDPSQYIDFSSNKLRPLVTVNDWKLAFESVFAAYEGAFRGIFRLLQLFLDPELERAQREVSCARRPLNQCLQDCSPKFSWTELKTVCGASKQR